MAVVPAILFLTASGLDAGPLEDEIQRSVSSYSQGNTSLTPDTTLDAAALIPKLYALRNYAPGWFGTQNSEQLFVELNKGLEQGFRPTDFKATSGGASAG